MFLNSQDFMAGWRWQDEPRAPEIYEICRKLKSGQTGVAECATELEQLLEKMSPIYSDCGPHKDFVFFSEVRRATQQFPLGHVRQYWSPEVLQTKDRELKVIEEPYREKALSEVQRIWEYQIQGNN